MPKPAPKPPRLPDLTITPGRPGMPMAVFVHGLGMSAAIWLSPEKERMLGGMLPLGKLLGKGRHQTLWHDLAGMGFALATWSQRRPVGPVKSAVRELGALMKLVREHAPPSVVIIGHSRGGLIARAWLAKQTRAEMEGARIMGLVTICSPHQGSALARWAERLRPAASALKNHLPENNKAEFSKGLSRALGFLSSAGVHELLPGSGFLASLPERLPDGVRGFSIGGTNPSFISAGGFSFPDSIIRALPDSMRPEELVPGLGDGLVSARSALLRHGHGHMDFPCNHLTALTDTRVREAALGAIKANFLP